MQSFYIGPAGARLYCNLHLPETRLVRDLGVLLCPPVGHEYYRTYRAHVRLAERLTASGFTAMRFDYLGTGDSEGLAGHVNLSGWTDDAATAANCLLAQPGIDGLLIAGMRFGSIVAALCTHRIDRLKGVLLWEPVVDGNAFVAQLEQLHDRMLKDQERFPHARNREDSAQGELVGHVYGMPLLDELRRLNAPQVMDGVALALFETGGSATDPPLNALPAHPGYGWEDPSRISETIVDPHANLRVVEMLEEMAA